LNSARTCCASEPKRRNQSNADANRERRSHADGEHPAIEDDFGESRSTPRDAAFRSSNQLRTTSI